MFYAPLLPLIIASRMKRTYARQGTTRPNIYRPGETPHICRRMSLLQIHHVKQFQLRRSQDHTLGQGIATMRLYEAFRLRPGLKRLA
jgi:hypothetical protein